MSKWKQAGIGLVIVCIFSGCNLISDGLKYNTDTKAFARALLKEDYNTCNTYIAIPAPVDSAQLADIRNSLVNLRQDIVNNFGTDLSYTFMKAEKTISTTSSDNKGTTVYLEFANSKEFGGLRFTFDDTSKKILSVKELDMKQSIPNLTTFWLICLIALCVPAFNIYVIYRIKKSSLQKKGWKYLAVVVLNAPSLTYTAISGLSFKLISVQMLLGFSFTYFGYIGAICTIGIPLGGLYWLWRVNNLEEPFHVRYTEDPQPETLPEKTNEEEINP